MNRFSFVCLCLTLAWACSVPAQDKPRYEGRTIQEWKEEWSPDDSSTYSYLHVLTQFGPLAKDEVPFLIELLKHGTEGRSSGGEIKKKPVPNRLSPTAQNAAEALAAIGPSATPALLKALQS